MPRAAMRLPAVGLAMLVGYGIAAANAAEIKVACAGAMRAAMQELAPKFEKSSGHKLSIEFATSGKVDEKIAAADEPIDVAILTKPRVDKLVAAAKLVGGYSVTLARVEIGMAVKQGAPKPDIKSVEGLKAALRNAKSIAMIDPATGGTSGIHLAKVLQQLGLADELKAKLHLVRPPAGQQSARAAELVQKGEAEIALQPISELQEVPGVEIVGPLPAELQTPDLVFVAAGTAISEQPLAAKELIDFLASPEAKQVYKSKGMEPG